MTTQTDKEAETIYKTAAEIEADDDWKEPSLLTKIIWLLLGMALAGWLVAVLL